MAVIEANDKNLKELAAEGVCIIDFYSTHCGPCRMLLPVLLEIESQLPFIKLIKVNTDHCPEAADEFKVLSLPTLFLAKDGVFTKYDGMRTGDDIRSAVGTLLYG